jgi:hypothetical protein
LSRLDKTAGKFEDRLAGIVLAHFTGRKKLEATSVFRKWCI